MVAQSGCQTATYNFTPVPIIFPVGFWDLVNSVTQLWLQIMYMQDGLEVDRWVYQVSWQSQSISQ